MRESENKENSQLKNNTGQNPPKRVKKIILWVFLGIFGFILLTGIILAAVSYSLYSSLKPEKEILAQRVFEFKQGWAEKNLDQIKEINSKLAQDLNRINGKINKYKFLGSLPVIKDYYSDSQNLLSAAFSGAKIIDIVVDSISPYSDLLGFGGAENAEGKTTLDRVTFVLTTLDKISPKVDEVNEEFKKVRFALDKIDPNRYPEKIGNFYVKENLSKAISLVDEYSLLLDNAKPLIEKIPQMMGVFSPRYYFLLLQNDAELRPTGGFMTAYGILKFDKGKVIPLLSEDIYSLDNKWGKKIPAPEPIKRYHKNVFYYYIRDMNLSPDFKESIEPVMDIYQNQIKGSTKVDGVIAVDTKLVASLLKVLGPIGVPEWGTFSADIDKRCDCPQVVYRLEEIADRPLGTINTSRKAVIGPLMHSILANAFGSPKEKIADLVNVGLTAAREKHLLVYFFDEEEQKAAEAFNLAGRVQEYDKDYQLLVDTNFAGAKSNLFIKQKVDIKVEISPQGEVTKTITVTYNNPYPPSDCNLERGGLCLNGLYRNWFRLYVPKGSVLLEMTGSEVEPKVYEELGKTVFEGFFGDKFPLRPQSMTKVTFRYKLPFKVNNPSDYRLLIQKQSGVEKYDLKLDVNGKIQELELREDKEFKF